MMEWHFRIQARGKLKKEQDVLSISCQTSNGICPVVSSRVNLSVQALNVVHVKISLLEANLRIRKNAKRDLYVRKWPERHSEMLQKGTISQVSRSTLHRHWGWREDGGILQKLMMCI
uniref:Uncharacterized protein n=1 Tax=Sphaerodactylus townsendi TaxID=933632 RepID=A0ACB8FJ01_9SAUR